jgi:hypothetical protein
MKSKLLPLVALVLLCLPAWGQGSKDWVDVQGMGELRALMAGKTFKDGWGTARAFRADGKGLFVMSSGARIQGSWTVKGNDRVCYAPQKGDTECWRVQRSGRDRSMVNFAYDNGIVVAYTMKDGVPDF